MKGIFKVNLILLCTYLPLTLISQNSFSVQNSRYDASFNHISYTAMIQGDDNLNSTLTVMYQREGENTWLESAPAMRAHTNQVIDGSNSGHNHHAASIMFLNPGEAVNIRVSLDDPDSNSFTEEITINTKTIPKASENARYLYVIPGNGNGSGTENDPYQGLQNAADNAIAGDVFLVRDGTYSPFQLLESGAPQSDIVFQSENLHGAIINGNGTDRGIITLGEFDIRTSNIIIDGFTIQNGSWGIDAQNTSFITVRNNIIRNVEFAYVNRRENGSEHDQYVTNNLITGRLDWISSGSEIPSSRAIDLRGTNNTVSYNTIKDFGDGISTDGPPYETSYGLDIHNNDIQNMVDDFIEVDGTVANTRVYENRGYNARAGISVAPIFGGPCYVFRNVLYNMDISAFKMNRSPAGLFLAHNSSCKIENGMSSPAGWQNTRIYNNIVYGTRYVFEEYGLVDSSVDIWDYNAYNSARTTDNWFKWDNNRFSDIEDLRSNTGIEANGIQIGLGDLITMDYPANYYREYTSDDHNFELSSNSEAINSGNTIPNINIPYVFDGMPDRGAYELNGYTPVYGHDFDKLSSLSEIAKSVEIIIYPNPATDMITVSTSGNLKIDNLSLYDNEGKLILTEKGNQLNLTDTPNGTYTVQVLVDGNVYTKKVMRL